MGRHPDAASLPRAGQALDAAARYAAWLGARAVGEAATRARAVEPAAVAAYLRSPAFEVAGFKGVRLSFRDVGRAMRQPVLLATARSLVSVSPQPGYLHQSRNWIRSAPTDRRAHAVASPRP